MNKALTLIEYAPFASIGKIWFTTAEYLLLYVLIISIFCFIYYKRSWLLKLSLACLLLLSISISFKRYNSDTTRSLAFLNLRKNTGMVFKSGNSAIVVSNLADTDKSYTYSVQPYLDSNKVSNTILLGLDQNISIPYLKKRGNLIQFYNKRILILDGGMANIQLPQKLKADYLYVTQNPHISLHQINKNYDYQTLVIDGSNSTQSITRLETEARLMHVNYRVIKRNISLVALSN
jgi:competence protein ComEC